LRIGLAVAAVQIVSAIVGRVISNTMKRGDERSDEFRVAAVLGGRKFKSRAENLRTASVVAAMGGVELDLRDATLDPHGATLDLRATMGGAQVTVPPGWAVDVEVEGLAGGFEVDVTPSEELPEDAPKLHIHAVTCMGGGQVTSAS
jgi:predicted membrane protein